MLAGLWACAASPAPTVPVRDPSRTTELAIFMRTRVNPAFSTLSLVLFHDDDRAQEVDPSVLPETADQLARATDGLVGWPDLPGESEQSKLVFHAYADSMKADTDKLIESVRDQQLDNARRLFESLHRKCDACHHFFRYDQLSVGRPGADGVRP